MLHESTTPTVIAAPLEVVEPTRQHWNDSYLLQQGDYPYRNPDELSALRKNMYDRELGDHYNLVWEEQQALLDLAMARLQGVEPSVNPEHVTGKAGLNLPNKVLTTDHLLVKELYQRMGPGNDMARSDILLTSLSGLVLDEVRSTITGEPRDHVRTGEHPFLQATRRANATTELLTHQPELAAGHSSELLLAAELLGEALRSPDNIRQKSPELVDTERIYQEAIPALCDVILPSLQVEYGKYEGNSSKRAGDKQKKIVSEIGRTIAVKYDALFDMLDTTDPQCNAQATELLLHMALEVSDFSSDMQPGYLYELFTPIMFRYAAIDAGVIASERIWHAPLRSDLPADRLGYDLRDGATRTPQNLATNRHKKIAEDTIIGRVDGPLSPYGRTVERWQLKLRTDAIDFQSEYNEKIVRIRSEDGIRLLAAAGSLLTEAMPEYGKLKSDEKNVIRGGVARSLLQGLIQEVAARCSKTTEHPQTIMVGDKMKEFAFGDFLERAIMPDYTRLFKTQA